MLLLDLLEGGPDLREQPGIIISYLVRTIVRIIMREEIISYVRKQISVRTFLEITMEMYECTNFFILRRDYSQRAASLGGQFGGQLGLRYECTNFFNL